MGELTSCGHSCVRGFPDNEIHGANMGPNWVLSALGGPHIGHMNLAIWELRYIICPL